MATLKRYLNYVLSAPEGIKPSTDKPSTDDGYSSPGVLVFSPIDVIIQPCEKTTIDTLVQFKLPTGKVLMLMDERLEGKKLYVEPHLVDRGYTVKVTLCNKNTEPVQIKIGDPLAQLVLLDYFAPVLKMEDRLPPANYHNPKNMINRNILKYNLSSPAATDPTTLDSMCPGVDIYSPVDVVIEPGQFEVIDSLVIFAIPNGKMGLLRSSIVTKDMLKVSLVRVGSDYRETVLVTLWNEGSLPVTVNACEPICQMILTDSLPPIPEEEGASKSCPSSFAPEIEFILTSGDAINPAVCQYESCINIFSPVNVVIQPNNQETIDTCVQFHLPADKEGYLIDKRHMYLDKKLKLFNKFVKEDNLCVTLQNMGTEPVSVAVGEPIAYVVVMDAHLPTLKRKGKFSMKTDDRVGYVGHFQQVPLNGKNTAKRTCGLVGTNPYNFHTQGF